MHELLVLNVLIFNVLLPKGEKEKKMKGQQKGAGPLNTWSQVTAARGGGACSQRGRSL